VTKPSFFIDHCIISYEGSKNCVLCSAVTYNMVCIGTTQAIINKQLPASIKRKYIDTSEGRLAMIHLCCTCYDKVCMSSSPRPLRDIRYSLLAAAAARSVIPLISDKEREEYERGKDFLRPVYFTHEDAYIEEV
jgi:hypothetical protein